ncbi:fluoride efflux transporter CrcB [Schlesneria sp.]|uniref:fluoride efflux transporter CrcB n=1 Tax=Schlesneria sp. TaxID=2762018 RepID=UPI002EE24000
MSKLSLIFVAGGLGALARFGLGNLIHRWYEGPFPLGTFVINVLGCLMFGFVWSLAEGRSLISVEHRAIILTGFMGAFTTFSTFAFETDGLIRDTEWLMAAGNIVGQVVLGLIAVTVGMAAGRLL